MFMRRWEVAGWLLVALGLWVFFEAFSLLTKEPPSLLPVGPLTFFGFVLFRGGIHLLKVSVAAQVCLDWQAQQRAKDDPSVRVRSAPVKR
jgi:hypothetical protein